MKRVIIIIILVAISAFIIFWGVWFISPESKSPLPEDIEPVFEIEPLPLPPPEKPSMVLTEELEQKPVPKKVVKKKHIKKMFYTLQIARCLNLSCVEDYKLMMQKRKLKIRIKNVFEKTIFFEVVSVQTFAKDHSAKWLQTIQQESGIDMISQEKDGKWQMILGAFPSQEKARAAMLQGNAKLKGWLTLQVMETQKEILYHDIYFGKFQTRQKAILLQETLRRQHEKFFNIRVIQQIK